jgi:hypothetical protein
MMPGFFKLMPKPKKGLWESSVWKTSFCGKREIWSKNVNGLLRAYLIVRFMALYHDFLSPSYNGEIGIDWKIKKLNNETSNT